MGCDIHLYKEKQVNGKWVTADKWVDEYGDGADVPWEDRFTGRNYHLFGLLSRGVREEHPFSFEPRGIPFNASKEVAGVNERWGGDGHSHSYLYLHELKDMLAHLEVATIRVTGMKHRDELAALSESIVSGSPDWDLLFPYCKFTNRQNCEHFEIDIPAAFYMGAELNRIISSFDGIDGDNHRIVFFFDN